MTLGMKSVTSAKLKFLQTCRIEKFIHNKYKFPFDYKFMLYHKSLYERWHYSHFKTDEESETPSVKAIRYKIRTQMF